MTKTPTLWPEGDLPTFPGTGSRNFQSLRYPLWTQNKARLIQAYLRLFVYITRHGAYIDGFAAPQDESHLDAWSAKLVLEMTPKLLRDFWLCDISPSGLEKLRALKAEHESKQRKITVLEGDFNCRVHDVLQCGRITEKTATFALLDQRTFECEWATVATLAKHKHQNKIELFYFFPSGWIDRSIAAVSAADTVKKVDKWWGGNDWRRLQGMDGTLRAMEVAKRFQEELGYMKASSYPIHSARRGGRVMYHMIHATDHPEATSLMIRAYRSVSGRPDLESSETQLDLVSLLDDLNSDR